MYDPIAFASRVENLEIAVFGTNDPQKIAAAVAGKHADATADPGPTKDLPTLDDLRNVIADTKNKGQQDLADLEGLGIAILLGEPDKFTIDTKGSPLVVAVGSGQITINGSITVDYQP